MSWRNPAVRIRQRAYATPLLSERGCIFACGMTELGHAWRRNRRTERRGAGVRIERYAEVAAGPRGTRFGGVSRRYAHFKLEQTGGAIPAAFLREDRGHPPDCGRWSHFSSGLRLAFIRFATG